MLELELTAATFNPARGICGAVDLEVIVAALRTRFRFWIAHEITAFMVSTNGSQKKRVQPAIQERIMAAPPANTSTGFLRCSQAPYASGAGKPC